MGVRSLEPDRPVGFVPLPRTAAVVLSAARGTSFVGDLAVVLGLAMLALLLRLPAFTRSVIDNDWDENLYFMMAESWRAGHLPYTTLFDNKPIGIYAIFAVFQDAFGDRIAAIRVASIVAVTATGFLVYRIAAALLAVRDEGARPAFAVFAGAIYVICSVFNGGMAANTELFVSPFTCAALLIVLGSSPAPHASVRTGAIAGLLIGMAVLVKPVAILEAPAVLAACVAVAVPAAAGRGWRLAAATLRLGPAMGAGILLPAVGVGLLYAVAGQLPLLIETNILANLRRAGEPITLGGLAHAALDQTLIAALYLAVVLLALRTIGALRLGGRRPHDPAAPLAILWLWLLGGFAAVVATKSLYDHAFIEPLPALCVAAAWVLAPLVAGGRALVVLLFIALGLFSGAAVVGKTVLKPALHTDHPGIGVVRDAPAQVAAAIAPELERAPGETVFVFDDMPIIYSLAHAVPPTRYAFPYFYIDRFGAQVAGIEPERVVADVLAKQPLFIVVSRDMRRLANPRNDAVYALMDQATAERYAPWAEFSDSIVYRRK